MQIMNPSKNQSLSWDALLFAALAFLYIALYQDAKGAFIVLAVTIYFLLDTLFPLSALDPSTRTWRWVVMAKMTMILFVVALVAILTTVLSIGERRMTTPEKFSNESTSQIEAALDFLARGISPYGQDYSDTQMGAHSFLLHGVSVSPGLKHFVYMPLILEMSFPFYWLSLQTLGWWDQRILYIALLLITLGILTMLTEDPSRKMSLMLFLGLNPLLMLGFLDGHNDIIAIFWVALAVLVLQRNHRSFSTVFFAMACISKQLVWFVAPFFVLYLLGPLPWSHRKLFQMTRELAPGILISLTTLLPFLLWTPQAFIYDTLIYMMGASGTETFLANGYGLGELLVDAGVLSNPFADFPFVWIELAVAIPLLVWLGRRLIQARQQHLIWLFGGVLSLAVVFFHRFYHGNYIGFFVFLIALGMFSDEPRNANDDLAIE